MNAASASGTWKATLPMPAMARPDANRQQQEQVGLLADLAQHARQQQRGDDGDDGECGVAGQRS